MICEFALCPHYHGSAYVPRDMDMSRATVRCSKADGTIRASRCPREKNTTLQEF